MFKVYTFIIFIFGIFVLSGCGKTSTDNVTKNIDIKKNNTIYSPINTGNTNQIINSSEKFRGIEEIKYLSGGVIKKQSMNNWIYSGYGKSNSGYIEKRKVQYVYSGGINENGWEYSNEPIGIWKVEYPDGIIKQGPIKNKRRNGDWKTIYPNGVTEIIEFASGTISGGIKSTTVPGFNNLWPRYCYKSTNMNGVEDSSSDYGSYRGQGGKRENCLVTRLQFLRLGELETIQVRGQKESSWILGTRSPYFGQDNIQIEHLEADGEKVDEGVKEVYSIMPEIKEWYQNIIRTGSYSYELYKGSIILSFNNGTGIDSKKQMIDYVSNGNGFEYYKLIKDLKPLVISQNQYATHFQDGLVGSENLLNFVRNSIPTKGHYVALGDKGSILLGNYDENGKMNGKRVMMDQINDIVRIYNIKDDNFIGNTIFYSPSNVGITEGSGKFVNNMPEGLWHISHTQVDGRGDGRTQYGYFKNGEKVGDRFHVSDYNKNNIQVKKF